MRVLGFVQCHYSGDYAREALLSIRDFCDKVYICHSVNPSHSFSTELECPETGYEIRKMAEEVLGNKLIFESYPSFNGEIEHREMRYKYAEGYDLLLVCDLDEVMENVPEALKHAYEDDFEARFYGTKHYRHFIKGNQYYFEDRHGREQAPIRIERLNVEDRTKYSYLSPLQVNHMTLAQSPAIMEYKLQVYGHKNEVHPDFFRKWTEWEPTPAKIYEITDLHPTIPDLWFRPIKLVESAIPELLKNHKPKEKKMLKLLWIPLDYNRHNDSPELFTDVLKALQVSFDTMIYQGRLDQGAAFKPDIVLFQGSMSITDLAKLKEFTGALTIMMTGDCRYAPMQSLMEYRSVVDCYLVPFSGELLNTYTTLLGKPCHFLWEFVQNWRFKKPLMMEEGPVTFVGNIYNNLPGSEGRKDLVDFIEASGVNINCWGSGFDKGEIKNTEVPTLYNQSYIVIAENNHDIQDYFTPRNLGGLAAGSCTLMKYFPGIEKFFQNLVHCIYYSNKYELLQFIELLKNNPELRNQIASQGHGLALTNFGLDSWVAALKQIINKYLK